MRIRCVYILGMKYPALGALLRSVRGAQALDQEALARLVGVRQQAVSGWERGASRPQVRLLPAVAQALNLDLADLRQAGHYDAPPAIPAKAPRLQPLPLGDLGDRAFETFCRDLLIASYPQRTATLNGASGQKQFGVDVFVDGEGERIGVQCKRHQTFGAKDVEKAIREVMPVADITRGVIALSRPTASPGARIAARAHPNWELWDGDDISARVKRLPKDSALALVDAYFAGWREPFLGIPGPSPWRKVADFAPPLAGKLGYEKDFKLTGRGREIDLLHDLVGRGEPVVFLVGRGGIGKTRLLSELGRTQTDREVRYSSGEPLSMEEYDLLPPGDPVVVLDDAGEADKRIPSLIQGVRAARPDATIVLATRPTAIQDLVTRMGLAAADADTVTVSVEDLSPSAAEELAALALGEPSPPYIVEALANIGYDCPLLIVLGAHLIRRGNINATRIGSNAELRNRILTDFIDAVVKGSQGEQHQAALEAVAALQPVRLDETEFNSALLDLSGLTARAVHSSLDALEDLGLVLRRGRSVRIVPDLLGEAVLERALVSRSGSNTRFAALIARTVRGPALTNAIRNVSIIDWRRRDEGASTLADVLWSALESIVLDASNSERTALASAVQAVAAVHAERALSLAATIMLNPAPDEADPLSTIWGGSGVITSADCARSLGQLIRNATFDLDHLEIGMRLLRDLGDSDVRDQNHTPEHGLRLLREIGEYDPYRHSLEHHERFLTEIATWLQESSTPPRAMQWLKLLEPLLAQQVTITRSRGMSFSVGRVSIDLDATAPVRSQVISVAAEHLVGPAEVSMQAVELLEHALRVGGKDEPVNDEFARLVDILSGVFTTAEAPAPVRLSAYRALGWHATYAEGPRQVLARQARRGLLLDADLLVIRMARSGRYRDEDDEEGDDASFSFGRSTQRLTEESHVVVRAWSELTDADLVNHLLNLLRAEHRTKGPFYFPEELMDALLQERPSIADVALAQDATDGPTVEALQASALGTVLGWGGDAGETEALSLIEQGPIGARIVVDAVTRQRREAVGPKRAHILRQLAALRDETVGFNIARSLRWFHPDDRSLAIELLLELPIGSNAHVAEEMAGVLLDGDVVGWSDLTGAQRSAVMAGLRTTPKISDYYVGLLLAEHLRSEPFEVLELLLARVALSITSDRSYEPLGHSFDANLNFRDAPDFPALLARVVEWMLDGEVRHRTIYTQELFVQVANVYDGEVLTTLATLVESNDEAKIELAGELLSKAPQDFVVRNVEFVTQSLAASESYPKKWAQRIRSGLHGAAIFGMRSRTVGEDDPADVRLKDDAVKVAASLPAGSAGRQFYTEVSDGAEARLKESRDEDRELAGRRRQW